MIPVSRRNMFRLPTRPHLEASIAPTSRHPHVMGVLVLIPSRERALTTASRRPPRTCVSDKQPAFPPCCLDDGCPRVPCLKVTFRG